MISRSIHPQKNTYSNCCREKRLNDDSSALPDGHDADANDFKSQTSNVSYTSQFRQGYSNTLIHPNLGLLKASNSILLKLKVVKFDHFKKKTEFTYGEFATIKN